MFYLDPKIDLRGIQIIVLQLYLYKSLSMILNTKMKETCLRVTLTILTCVPLSIADDYLHAFLHSLGWLSVKICFFFSFNSPLMTYIITRHPHNDTVKLRTNKAWLATRVTNRYKFSKYLQRSVMASAIQRPTCIFLLWIIVLMLFKAQAQIVDNKTSERTICHQ